jgi:predicted alpha/beta-fold hydrolase
VGHADGDFIDLDWASRAKQAGRLLALFHGWKAVRQPYARASPRRRCGRLALRGAAFSRLLGRVEPPAARLPFGDSAEIGWIWSAESRSASGISLGGNALLKYLGEQGSTLSAEAVAISAPLDLAAAGRALDRGLSREIYTRMFLGR